MLPSFSVARLKVSGACKWCYITDLMVLPRVRYHQAFDSDTYLTRSSSANHARRIATGRMLRIRFANFSLRYRENTGVSLSKNVYVLPRMYVQAMVAHGDRSWGSLSDGGGQVSFGLSDAFDDSVGSLDPVSPLVSYNTARFSRGPQFEMHFAMRSVV